jgi:methylenetetrahydrofolate dehydrogenase (NADP+)/methenyltetrahydrofolate cyclohydrolase
MQLIDGKAIAMDLREDLAREVEQMDIRPGLAVILVGDDEASAVYVRNKIRASEKAGIQSFEHRLSGDISQQALLDLINELNGDSKVHGILLQLPLPKHLNASQAIEAINPDKDVDGLHPLNVGRLVSGLNGFVPCTPQGSLKLIKQVENDLTSMHGVVIGRSLLFGKPMGQLLLAENCTVTQTHSKTRNLSEICQQADILIAAVGVEHLVKKEWVKKDAIIIDVGINRRDDGTLTGDVDFNGAKDKARAMTPVPGGVGPMTIACLLSNTVRAAQNTVS